MHLFICFLVTDFLCKMEARLKLSKEPLISFKVKKWTFCLWPSCCVFDPRMSRTFLVRRQILDSSKLKEFADDNFKFDENGREFFKRVENTVHYEQFLLFPQCFQKGCFPGASKGVIVWEWVNGLSIINKC